MKTKNKKYLLGVSLIACLVTGGLFAKSILSWLYPSVVSVHSLVIARDIPVYTHESAAIIVGVVQEVSEPYWGDDHAMVQRDVEIAVDEVLKGDPQMTDVTVTMEGGKIGKERFIVEDAVRFQLDEEVLLFLGVNHEEDYVVFAGPYGKYLISDDGTVVSSIGDFTMPLDDLKEEILDSLETTGPQAKVKQTGLEQQLIDLRE